MEKDLDGCWPARVVEVCGVAWSGCSHGEEFQARSGSHGASVVEDSK